MTGIPERELSILLHSSRYDLSPFDSGDAELYDFLKNDALREQKGIPEQNASLFL
jgi:hypothetical protein